VDHKLSVILQSETLSHGNPTTTEVTLGDMTKDTLVVPRKVVLTPLQSL
jgi:hypothetical protein